jgi:hypothetical protein
MYNLIKTEELKAIAEVNAMNTHAQNALRQLQSFAQQAYEAFWYGETSPSLKVTLLGTEAIKVFTDSSEVQSFLASKIDGYVPLSVPIGYNVSFAEDGSAEISYALPVVEQEIIHNEQGSPFIDEIN